MRRTICDQLALLFLAAVASMGTSCQHMVPPSADAPQPKSVRVSDRYFRASVASYDVFKGEIDQHNLAMIRLVSGEGFPMVCHIVDGGVYPISQSVFSTGGDATEWDIMCEPRIDQTYALMRLNVSSEDGILRVGGDKLERLASKPELLRRPTLRSEIRNPKS